MNRLQQILCLALAWAVNLPTTLWAQLPEHTKAPDAAAFSFARERAQTTMVYSEQLVYVLGALCIMGLGVVCMMGRFSWKWFFTAIAGIIIAASTAMGIEFLTGQAL